MLYLWLKALHVAAVATWIGGLLVAALAVAAAGASAATTSATEPREAGGHPWLDAVRRWDRRVTSPAMLLVWGLGITLAVQGGWFSSGWLTAKLALVAALSALHGVLSGTLRRAAASGGIDRAPPRSVRRYAGPSVITAVVLIAVLAVTKPF